MILRNLLAGCMLLVLVLAQFLVLTLPSAWLLSAADAPSFAVLGARISTGTPPQAIGVAVAVAVVLGSAAAVALWRLQLRGITIGVILAPLLLPIAALAQGGHAQAQMLVLAGHASLGLAFGTGCSFARLAHVDRGVLRAAMCCGVSPLGTVRRVLLPLMAPGIWAGALLAALGSLGLSLATLIHGTPAPLTAMPVMPPAFWLTIAGSGLLFCAVTTLALRLLRRA